MGYLLANGCSWTDPNYNPNNEKYFSLDHKFTTWPEVLGHYMDLDVVNIGLSGSSNRSIVARTFDYLVSHDDDLPEYCFIQLSEWDRFNMVSIYSHYHLYNPLNMLAIEQRGKVVGSLNHWQRDLLDKFENSIRKDNNIAVCNAVIAQDGPTADVCIRPEDFIDETLRNLYMLYSYCNKINVKLFVFQGLRAWQMKRIYDYFKRYGVPERCKFNDKHIHRLQDVDALQGCWDNNIFATKLSKAEDNENLTLYNWPFFNIDYATSTDITSLIVKQTWEKFMREGLSYEEATMKQNQLLHIIPNIDSHPSEWMHDRMAQLIYESIRS